MNEKSLAASIRASLDNGEILESLGKALLDPSKTQVKIKDETQYWDYKEDLDLQNPIDVAKLAKRVLGFHNAKGGALFFGITNDFDLKGFYETKVVDTVRLKNKLKKYIGNSVSFFQGQIPIHHPNKIVWALFVYPRTDLPVAVQSNGPSDKSGIPIIRKGQYYIRVMDETKLCIDPNDFERLFSGTSFKHLQAYAYEHDDLFFRLLAPHHTEFIGRKETQHRILSALSFDNRGYLISLEGVGGVGKSALAIEVVKKLYKEGSYDFIISMSAKNRVWHVHTESRQAGFSGYTELIHEIAKVLGIDIGNKGNEDIENNILALMAGSKGLLFIDNVEEIQDTLIFEFIKKIPYPVKVLLTSRITKYQGLPTEAIFIKELDWEEADDLLKSELEKIGYSFNSSESDDAREIIEASGRLPLSIKWAVSLTRIYKSLHNVSRQLRSKNMSKKEFLDFCYATMYEGLSNTAQNVAQLCHYLGNDWNVFSLSIALEETESDIKSAIEELESNGLLSRTASSDEAFSMLPLTMDFLADKFHKNQILRTQVEKRIADAVTSPNFSGNIFNLPVNERISLLSERARQSEKQGEYEHALKLIKLALQYIADHNGVDARPLQFLEGEIVYKSGQKSEGITRMLATFMPIEDSSSEMADEAVLLSQYIFNYGNLQQEDFAMNLATKYINQSSVANEKIFGKIFSVAIREQNYRLLSDLIRDTNNFDYAYWSTKAIWEYLDNSQISFMLGEPVIRLLKTSTKSDLPSSEEKKKFIKKANLLQEDFTNNLLT